MAGVESLSLFAAAATLGIFLGAQLTEACLMVPVWKKLEPDEFFRQHEIVAPRIYRFFAPLTIAATIIPLSASVIGLLEGKSSPVLLILMGASTAAFFSTYFIYFKNANQALADRAMTNEELPQTLNKWANWHWARVILEAIAFVCSLVLLSGV